MVNITAYFCPCDLIDGKFLLFDYDFYKSHIKLRGTVTKLVLNTKLTMWAYYLRNPQALPSKFLPMTAEIETYKNRVTSLLIKDYSYVSFDAETYLSTYPDVSEHCKKSPVKAYSHFIHFGLAEGRQFLFKSNEKKDQPLIMIDAIIEDSLKKYKINDDTIVQLVILFKSFLSQIMSIEKLEIPLQNSFGLIEDIFSVINFNSFIIKLKSAKNLSMVLTSIRIKLDQHSQEINNIAKKSCSDSNCIKVEECKKLECLYCHPNNFQNQAAIINSSTNPEPVTSQKEQTSLETSIEVGKNVENLMQTQSQPDQEPAILPAIKIQSEPQLRNLKKDETNIISESSSSNILNPPQVVYQTQSQSISSDEEKIIPLSIIPNKLNVINVDNSLSNINTNTSENLLKNNKIKIKLSPMATVKI